MFTNVKRKEWWKAALVRMASELYEVEMRIKELEGNH